MGALAGELGGDDKVKWAVATTAMQDPHHVEAKPSLIARVRNADLVNRHRGRAGNGVAPDGGAAGGQSEGARGAARVLRGGGVRADAREAPRAWTGRKATCTRPATPKSRPIRATSPAWRRPLASPAGRGRSAQCRTSTARGRWRFATRWAAAIARWEKDAAPHAGRAGAGAAKRPSPTSSTGWGSGRGRARTQAGRRAHHRAPVATAGEPEGPAGEDGRSAPRTRTTAPRSGWRNARR